MTNTWIDGGGAVADRPLPYGTWIRFVLDPTDNSKDITVYVLEGKLHVRSPYRMIDTHQNAANALDIVPLGWPPARP